MPRGRPISGAAQVPGDGPVATATLEKAGPERYEITRPKLFWHGTLPSDQPIVIRKPTREADEETGEYWEWSKPTTSKDLWFSRKQGNAMWMGKCPWYQGLDVTGLTCPAYTDSVTDQITTSGTNRQAWPGLVSVIKPSQMKSILKSFSNMVIRIEDGTYQIPRDEWRFKRQENVYIVNLRHGHAPAGMDEKTFQSLRENGRATSDPPEERMPGDIPVSDFVYLEPLDVPVNTKQENYYTLVPSFHEFFDNPPSMLSDYLREEG